MYGLVSGPLLSMPEVSYVKAFYDRPLAESGRLRPSGGGRVTEILIRPLFSLFFPELSALIQPLSGEYAVRRIRFAISWTNTNTDSSSFTTMSVIISGYTIVRLFE